MTPKVVAPVYLTVLVPLDGSHVAAEALPPAVETGRQHGAALVLLHVIPAGAPTREREAQRVQMQAYLEGLVRSLKRAGLKVSWLIEEGEPAETIARVAARMDNAIVVLAESGRSASDARGSQEGSGAVAEAVSHLWRGPTLLVRHSA